MAKLLVGIIIGIVMSADAFMVGFCIWYEKRFPQSLARCRRNCSGIVEIQISPRYTSGVRRGAVDCSRERRLS